MLIIIIFNKKEVAIKEISSVLVLNIIMEWSRLNLTPEQDKVVTEDA